MPKAELRTRGGATVDADLVTALAETVAGRVIRPGDADYDDARRIWNASIDKHPGLIVRCAGTADVVASVKFAGANDVVVAVRGGGHNVAGRALVDNGLVIDLSAMRTVFVDPQHQTVRVQGGATLGDVDRETHVYGLAVPAGVVSKTGIGGLALGGGVGWLVRKYGPTCDNVLAFSLVDAEGDLLTASAEENPDLFWALKGGGGNFGVVTSFLFQAYPVATVLGGLIVHARERAPEVVRHYRDFMKTAPVDLTAYCAFVTTPDGMPAVGIVPCWSGDLAEGERVLQPLRAFGPPLADMVQPMPFPAMQQLLDGAFPDGTYNYWKSSFIRELSDAAIDVIIDHANRMRSPLSNVVIEFYGGRADTADSAFTHRQTEFDIGCMAQWTDPAESEMHAAWARDMAGALEPFSTGGYLLNFVMEDDRDVIQAAFGPAYSRLAEVKKKYDPANFFSVNQNIRPAA